MQEKQARLVVLIDPQNQAAFEAMCASRDLSASEGVRQLIVDSLARQGVTFRRDGEPGPTPAS